MIAPMKKIIVVSRGASREELLLALRELGVLHLEPADPMAAAPDKLLAELALVRRSRQAIGSVEPSGRKPDLDAHAAAEEILSIVRRGEEGRNRLSVLAREAARAGLWGDLRLEQLQAIAEAGVPVKFYMVPAKLMSQVEAECVANLADMPGKQVLAAVVQREGEPSLPEEAEPVQPPDRDLPTIRAEAKELDAALAADAERLADLASLGDELAAEQRRLEAEGEFAAARAGGLQGGNLYALQGWAPIEAAETLAGDLAAAGLGAALQIRDPDTDEEPPTLIRYPRWVKPIKGLFDVLETDPGYREVDLSGFFMVFLPIFAGMLIGDAGYGLLFLLGGGIFYRRLCAKAGKPGTTLLIVVGAATLLWGVLTANYFGVTPAAFSETSALRRALVGVGVLWRADEEAARFLIIKVSFIVGCVHLVLAHLRQAVGYWPSPKAWSEIGWCAVLVGMLGVVWKLFEFAMPPWLLPAAGGLLAVGYVTAVFFSYPDRPLGKRIGVGIAASLLPLVGTFGDMVSYIRLMAVGLASYYIASAFNGLGAMVAQSTPVLWAVGVPVILFGHALNIGLAVIAVFAHGVRLNMLEFSNNAGVRWAGYAYKPFAK